MRPYFLRFFIFLLLICLVEAAGAQSQSAPVKAPPGNQAPAPPANELAQKPGSQLITLEQAIQMAQDHNHNLLATRATVRQNEAEEITANLRPDPVLLGDVQYLPIFQPSNLSWDYI